MAYDPATHQLVLFGGYDSKGVWGDTWIWNGSSWTEVATTGPDPRAFASMAYDPATSQLLLFGGTNFGEIFGDSWSWDGSSWNLVNTGGPNRQGASMDYDGATSQMVLFGGNTNGYDGDTWTWDGSTWTQVSTTGPSPRWLASMAYDPASSQLILVGGQGPGSTGPVDQLGLWSWSGTSWGLDRNQPDAGNFDSASMAYDPALSQLVLYGGQLNLVPYGLEETWDGREIQGLATQATPSPDRYMTAMAYDPDTAQLVLFGGVTFPLQYFSDTWSLGPVPDNDLSMTGMPNDMVVDATSPAGAVVTYTSPVAVDADDSDTTPAVSCAPRSGSTFPIGTTRVTCTATDSDDTNSPVSASFLVTVRDDDLTLTNVPANMTVDATSPAGAVVHYSPPTVVDENTGPGAATVACSPPSGSTFPIGTTTVTCRTSGSDDLNAPVTASFTVTVRDDDLALANVPANMTVDATSPAGAVVSYTPPTVVDEDSPATASANCAPASGTTFPIGTTKVTCSATDSDDSNSPVSASFSVTVRDDDLALANVPANMTVDATSPAGAEVSYDLPSVVDEDAGTGAASVSCSPPPGSVFPIGTTKVTCTTTGSDDLNGPVSATFSVTVRDDDLALSNMPADITAYATSSAGAVVTYTPPNVVDEDSPATATAGCTPASGSTFAVGITTVTCTARDADDLNSPVSGGFTVTVKKVPTTLTASPASISLGILFKEVGMSAKLTSNVTGAPISGQTVTFAIQGVSCSATTNAQGVASCAGVYPLLAILQPIPATYSASFAGSGPYLPSSAKGSVNQNLLAL